MINISIAYYVALMLNITDKNYFNVEEYQDKYNNTEIVAKINIYDTDINNLVTKTYDNDYYLTYSLEKKETKKGNIFIDYRNNLIDKKIIIYGHNSKKYTADFKELENYMDYNYFISHKYIDLKTTLYDNKYEIFSVALYSDDYEYLKLNINDWNNHFSMLKNNSLYETNVDINKDDSIIVLQTCSQKYENTFLVISAKKI